MAVAKKRHKSFTRKDRKQPLPLSFDLYDEDFEARPELQGAVILEFASAFGPGDEDDEEGGGGADAGMVLDFFNKALLPESLKRFKALTHDPDRIVDIEELIEIVSFLLENYTSRNLEESSESPKSS